MTASFRLDRNIPILSLQGRLDARGAAAFEQTWRTLSPDTAHVVFDMSEVQYLSSIGIGSLVTAERVLRQRHGRSILAGLSPSVARVLEITGVLREFQQAPNVTAAVENALAATAVHAASTEHEVGGRRYRISPGSSEGCVMEVWGDYQQEPASVLAVVEDTTPRRPIGATLEELGFAFGEGGFGNAGTPAADCIGTLLTAGKFAGVLPAGAEAISDFVISGRPDEVDLVISRAIGFSGHPSYTVEMSAPAPAALQTVMSDVTGLIAGARPVMGFVVQGTGSAGVLLVGLRSADGKLHGSGIRYAARPTLAPKIEDLKEAFPLDGQAALQSATISLYVPRASRLGVEKRLKIQVEDGVPLEEEWVQIIRNLYRDCSRVILTQLTGGYMAKTFRVSAYDRDGRRMLPTVLKISTNELIEREEEAHRAYVQKFILNNSTTIMGTAKAGAWSALRYNFLGISGPDTTLSWVRNYYQTRSTQAVLAVFHRLYTQILKPWYGQPRWEPIQLYADHTPLRLFPDLCAHAQRDFGFPPDTETIDCEELGIKLSNPFLFLRTEYQKRMAKAQLWYQGVNHGDLNLRNILIDEQENLYVIDFSETKPRNIVSDFARMETILKFEMTRLASVDDLARMTEFEQGLAEARSLPDVPPNRYRGDDPSVEKAYASICRLRSYANTATLFETDLVPYWLALLEWTYSVLSYDLPPLRRKLAAYSAAIICGRIQEQTA